MHNPHPNLAPSSSQSFDKPLFQAGQFIDMQFMASTTFNRSASKPLLRSLDSQEFGFASNLVNSTEVAPADELFFKGQLLPLQLDHRLHLVQALSSSSCLEHMPNPTIATARVGSSKLARPDLCPDDDVIEFNSCRLERKVSVEYLKDSMQGNTSEDHMLLNHMQCLQSSKVSSSYFARDDKLKRFSSKTKGFSELDCSVCARNRAADRNGEHGILSWCEDEELHSSNHDMGTVDYKFASMNDATTDPGSSSFRSQNSGFWDSGTDKDMMDSSSSRDSNGSSQDSYFHTNHTHIKAPPFINAPHHHHHLHSKPMSFSIPWKLALFRKGSCRKQAPPQDSSLTFTKVGFSEDLGKYKTSAAPPLNEIKEALLPLKLEREANNYKEEKQLGDIQRRLYSSATNDDGYSANVMTLCKNSTHVRDAGVKKSLVQDGSRSCRMSMAKAVDVGAPEEEAKKQGSAAVKERWQMCARRLKPLCEMKRGWMGQFRMDECGKRAYCEVEHGTIYSSRPANGQMQRKLSHQPSSSNALKGHKLSLQHQKQANGYPYKVLAMTSCPSSTISSPNHSGVLAVLDPNQRTATPNKPAHSSKTSSKLLNHPLMVSTSAHDAGASIIKSSIKSSGNAANDGGNHNYRSISTMQELHSALQGAISHCKESNKKLNYAANN